MDDESSVPIIYGCRIVGHVGRASQRQRPHGRRQRRRDDRVALSGEADAAGLGQCDRVRQANGGNTRVLQICSERRRGGGTVDPARDIEAMSDGNPLMSNFLRIRAT